MKNPAYTQWVEMVKGDEVKLVHPGNVVNHERFGWVRKVPVESEKPDEALSLPELVDLVDEHAAQTAAVAVETAPAEAAAPVVVDDKPKGKRSKK